MTGRPPKNITGKKSCGGTGKLTAIKPTNKKSGLEVVWLCKCDCGNFHKIRVSNFSTTNSCGCSQRDHLKNNTYSLRHGHTGKKWKGRKSPTFISWEKMKYRITNPDERMKKYYNHLTICERWMEFENFLEDMGERPEGHEIHRLDNSKGYYPENCEWKERIKHRREHTK